LLYHCVKKSETEKVSQNIDLKNKAKIAKDIDNRTAGNVQRLMYLLGMHFDKVRTELKNTSHKIGQRSGFSKNPKPKILLWP